ncbi:GT2 family glycosyltransferase [Flavimobilis soli]|uniref:GT2 family glycosyltransferase n=1 Tax=Flavimobilis soli TaxID=442709 RepID=A0A2A9EH67_9MICO|nr:GT2 family glycosyltransferase [Flavimobilis soli]
MGLVEGCAGILLTVAESRITRPEGRIVAVLVAYNRRDLLIAALDALQAQDRPLDGILVINNASTDDTEQVAQDHPANPTVITLDRNEGGAGGFAAGLAHAVASMDADGVWLMDDDTIPTPSALRELLAAWRDHDGPVDVAGSRVVWTDGRDHPMNTPRPRPRASARQRAAARAVGAVPVRSTSFVSMLVSADAVRTHGLPVADYFIWNDDFEYSCRILKDGTGLHVPASVVEHRTKTFGATDADPGARFYFEVRNKIWMLTRSTALTGPERVLYTGATLRRWYRTFRGSQDRATLWDAARRGLLDGVRRRPRDTTTVMAGLSVTDDVRALDRSAR